MRLPYAAERSSSVPSTPLEGQFRSHRPHVIAHVAEHLARMGVSIKSGTASRADGGRWSVRFDVDATRAAADAARTGIDALATMPPPAAPSRNVRVRECTTRSMTDGSLEVLIRADDVVGLLGELLRRFGMFALFPVRIEVETVGDEARDRFVLRGLGDEAVSYKAEALLARSLGATTLEA